MYVGYYFAEPYFHVLHELSVEVTYQTLKQFLR